MLNIGFSADIQYPDIVQFLISDSDNTGGIDKWKMAFPMYTLYVQNKRKAPT